MRPKTIHQANPTTKSHRERAGSASIEIDLPTPAERPDALLVIYDGQCQFCRQQVLRLLKFDGGGRLAFVSLHDPMVAERFPHMSHDELMKQMYVVDENGQMHGGAAAIRFLSRRLPRMWFLAPLMHLPFSLPLWQWCYDRIAARRYRLSKSREGGCQDDVCEIHFKR